MQEKFKLHFENLANNIFDEKTNKFKQQSQEILNECLSPLKERITEFHKKVDESFGTQAKEQFALKEEIKRIVEVNEKMTFQTESLAKALKGDMKVQGNWGEIILEKILEESGLRKDEDYILQGVDMQLKHPEGGQPQKPDVIVKLPEEKHIIIDSKVSLTHYERFCAEEEDGKCAGHLKQFLLSVKNHVLGLEQRRYQDIEKLSTPDFVLMFMPIEGVYALAVQKDRDLHSFAWSKKIIIVCPSTLYATLRTIASLWRLELQNQNALEIATRGGALYDKIAGFVEDMQKIGNQLETINKTYTGAMIKLSDGRGNILRQTQQLKALGAKASKSLPKELINNDDAGESDDLKLSKVLD
jgi:DNA recombination protein RmuC